MRLDKTGKVISLLSLPVRLAPSMDLRNAESRDLDTLITLLSDDPASRSRGDIAADDDRDAYAEGLRDILDDFRDTVVVAVGAHDEILGMMQLTRIPGLARRGSTRLLVEAVRVSASARGQGIGTAMMLWVIDVAAPATGASLIQLTSDAQRTDAHRFYTRLGFADSHVGFKLKVWR